MWKKKLEVASEARDDQTWIYTLSGSLFGSTEASSQARSRPVAARRS